MSDTAWQEIKAISTKAGRISISENLEMNPTFRALMRASVARLPSSVLVFLELVVQIWPTKGGPSELSLVRL